MQRNWVRVWDCGVLITLTLIVACTRLSGREDAYASPLEADIRRASAVVHISAQELATIAEEALDE
jgi:hypothetical protein